MYADLSSCDDVRLMTFLMCGWPVVLAESLDGNALSNCSWESVFALCTSLTLPNLETDWIRGASMTVLGNGLSAAKHHEDALSVKETELSMLRRLGDSESNILIAQSNLANTYQELGRLEEALLLKREVYSGHLKLNGEESERTLRAANNLADTLCRQLHFEEARSLLRKTIPAARRVLGEGHRLTLKMRMNYARALYLVTDATLDDLREAVTTLEETTRLARSVLGGAHPTTVWIEGALQGARTKLAQSKT